MKTLKLILTFSLLLLFAQCNEEALLPDSGDAALKAGGKKDVAVETAGNNLSFPVLWADDYDKPLPGIMGEYSLNGVWWYVWGPEPIDPNSPIYSCQPNPANPAVCLDGTAPGDGVSTVYKAYVQKDVNNSWQAFNATPTNGPVNVDLIDWGDDLESVNWTVNSMVRCEVVLFEVLDDETYNKEYPMYPQFPMRHVYGWGASEVHGVPTSKTLGDKEPIFDMVSGDTATVYSHNARFTIQKLNVSDLASVEGKLEWVANEGWKEIDPATNLINDPIFNMPVYEGGDGPGYYAAEINVKGRVIYGYTWAVRKLNEGDGYYRLTFSLDETGGIVPLNTYFDEGTQIIIAEEEEEEITTEAEEGERGGTGVIDVANNLTYMDILITAKTTGGGKGSGGSGGSGGGNGVPGGGKGRN